MPVISGLLLYGLTRRLKAYSGSDVFYFAIPYLYINYGTFVIEQRKLYEMGYPAHPFIQQQRTDVLNKTCFKYPQIVKNEIEYLHTKVNTSFEDATDEYLQQTRFERVFTTGKITSDY